MYKETVSGQDIFIKGGHDANLVPSRYPSMSEPIVYNNTKIALQPIKLTMALWIGDRIGTRLDL